MRIAFNNVEFVGRDSKFVNALIVSYQNGFRTGLEWRCVLISNGKYHRAGMEKKMAWKKDYKVESDPVGFAKGHLFTIEPNVKLSEKAEWR